MVFIVPVFLKNMIKYTVYVSINVDSETVM